MTELLSSLTEFLVAVRGAQPLLLSGLVKTAEAAILAILLGTAFGLIFGLMLVYGGKILRLAVKIYVDVARGIPGLVKIFTVYYLVNQLVIEATGYRMSAMLCGIIALAIHASAQIAEMTRGAIQALPRGQSEAGKAIGLTFGQIQFNVIFPQAIRQILPTWVTSAGEVVKGTTLLSLISVPEFFVAIKEAAAREYIFFSFYLFAMLVYFVIIYGIELFGRHLEARFNKY